MPWRGALTARSSNSGQITAAPFGGSLPRMARRAKCQSGLTQISRTARAHPVPSSLSILRGIAGGPSRMTPELSESDAARFRAFERTRYQALAESYDNFFTPVTTNANAPLLKA